MKTFNETLQRHTDANVEFGFFWQGVSRYVKGKANATRQPKREDGESKRNRNQDRRTEEKG